MAPGMGRTFHDLGVSKSLDEGVSVVTGRSPTVQPTPTEGAHTPPGSDVGSVSSHDSCGPDAPVSHPLPVAEICVIYWCKGEVFTLAGRRSRTSMQVKLRTKITNNSDKPLDVRLSQPSAIVLLIGGSNANRRWDPPPLTARSGVTPRRVGVDGATFWAIPPNVNNDVAVAPNGYYTGFASTWTVQSIAPGSSYLETSRDSSGQLVHNGNLVFEVPMDTAGAIHPVGIALLDRMSGRVLAFHGFAEWGAPSSPQSF
jgi:hypothetical protein